MQSFRSLTHVDSLDLPDGARVYKVPKSVSAIGIVGLIVFGIFCIPTLLFPALEPNKNTRPLVIVRVPIFAGFRSSLPLVPARLQARRDLLQRTAYRFLRRASRPFFSWDRIAILREHPFMQRLGVTDASGHLKISLEYHSLKILINYGA